MCFILNIKSSRLKLFNLLPVKVTTFSDILSHIVKSGCQSQFIAEVTNKTRADVKGTSREILVDSRLVKFKTAYIHNLKQPTLCTLCF